MGYESYIHKDKFVIDINDYETIQKVNDLLLLNKSVSSKVESIYCNVSESMMLKGTLSERMTIIVSDVTAFLKINSII